MAAVSVCSDFGAQGNKICHCFHFPPFYLWWMDVMFKKLFIEMEQTSTATQTRHIHSCLWAYGLSLAHSLKPNLQHNIFRKSSLTLQLYLFSHPLTQHHVVWLTYSKPKLTTFCAVLFFLFYFTLCFLVSSVNLMSFKSVYYMFSIQYVLSKYLLDN